MTFFGWLTCDTFASSDRFNTIFGNVSMKHQNQKPPEASHFEVPDLTLKSSAKTNSSSSPWVNLLSFHFSRSVSRHFASCGPLGTPACSNVTPLTGNLGKSQSLNSSMTSLYPTYFNNSMIWSLLFDPLPLVSHSNIWQCRSLSSPKSSSRWRMMNKPVLNSTFEIFSRFLTS